jgi:putative ABC transport system permease protein
MMHDLRAASRSLTRAPGFALATILMLAVGIGANTALFSVIDTVLLRQLPYDDPDRAVTVWEYDKRISERADVAAPNYVDWRAQSTSFAFMAMVEPFSFDFYGGSEPAVWRAGLVTDEFFDAIGARTLFGRTFAPDDYTPGRDKVVVLGFSVWQQHFGGDRGIVGRSINLDEQIYTVVGVLPRDFQLRLFDYEGQDVWVPKIFRPNELTSPSARLQNFRNVVARLKPSVSIEQARAEMDTIAANLARQYPTSNANTGVSIVPLHEQLFGHLRPALLVLLGAVGFVLLIACANVANLLLARGVKRERELSIRTALGASRSRLVRQLLTESVLLGSLGCAAGLALAYAGIQLIVGLAPGDVPHLDTVAIDVRIVTFAIVVAACASILFGLAPSWQLSKLRLRHSLSDGGRTATMGSAKHAVGGALVVAEIAMSLVLLIGASLLVRSFVAVVNVDPGFRRENLLALQVFAFDRKPTADHRAAFFDETLVRINGIPGVTGAAAVQSPPMFLKSDYAILSSFTIEGRPTTPSEAPSAYGNVVTPNYFAVMGVPILRGRDFNDRDRRNTAPVAIINETVARREWPNENPIGRKISTRFGPVGAKEVVGVVGDIKQDGLDKSPRPEVYLPHAQLPQGAMTYVVRTAADPAGTMQAVKEQVWSVDKLQSFHRTATMDELVETSFAGRRFSLVLLGGFAVISLLLAITGLYSVISFVTAQRTSEIGVRMAIGASGIDILRLVIRQAFVLVGAGVALGIGAALLMTRLLEGLLFGTAATDPATFALVCLVLFAVALVACGVPARRAMKVDPIVALRYE